MTSSRPYLLRALYEWILENECTPYIVVNAYASGVQVPQEFVKDGQIILNISPAAVHALQMNNDAIDFNGRFSGIPTPVFVPIAAVMGIYARENGQGMVFESEPQAPDPEPTPPEDKPGKPGSRPALRVVK
ncbi:ClpXP protease specificity-enhancing factor [Pseudohongiella spirulinae]|uniref:Peptidase n=1 Tax=Pseudohongiella spirulinae TaxID=1249552 RepID=A0A0S2KFZ0_9GAMM|nr:ClpXP protease specificity-enhancing factor [Pseudohongiella spirulinae]ALO46948.1 Peptidase [Pseudohongiella spirulinae]